MTNKGNVTPPSHIELESRGVVGDDSFSSLKCSYWFVYSGVMFHFSFIGAGYGFLSRLTLNKTNIL